MGEEPREEVNNSSERSHCSSTRPLARQEGSQHQPTDGKDVGFEGWVLQTQDPLWRYLLARLLLHGPKRTAAAGEDKWLSGQGAAGHGNPLHEV